MIKNYYKHLLLFALICCSAYGAHAQRGYDFDRVDLGLSAQLNQVYGDTESRNTTFSAGGTVNYNPHSPFVNFVLEFQVGSVSGGDSVKYQSGRQYKNDFYSVVFRGQVQAGEFIDYSQSQFKNALKNLYLSTGIGVVDNNLKYASRVSNTTPVYVMPGKNNSTEFFIPLRLGYEFKIFDKYNNPSVKIDLAYQSNFMLSENLDGYDGGSGKDIWNQISLGVKFSVGGTTSYRKPVSFY